MKYQNLKRAIIILILGILFSTSYSQIDQDKNVERMDALLAYQIDPSQQLLAVNASQYGVRYPETFVLMQNRMGVRIEYCVDRSRLQLWISPQAGKSFDYYDKNYSNRDDHTNIFDRILLPELNFHEFERCDFDPFHSILYYKNQTVHLAQVYDQPAVLVWFENGGMVDLKLYGQTVERSEKAFVIDYDDRGRQFQSAAMLGPGDGYFRQQLVLDKGRSIHTRAHLTPNQILVLAGELQQEQIFEIAANIAQQPIEQILAESESKIQRDLQRGRFQLKNKAEMQKLLKKSRRVALSMQDFKGFMRSTNQYIYYLLWYRDGGMNTGHITYTGWVNPVTDHINFALQNPNVSYEQPAGKFFGQVMAGPVTKWEEDGLFFVVWPAFAYWTQTGDDRFCKGEYLKTMEDALDWLEQYCFDQEKGLFGRYHYCETPLTGSRGYGWDNATGAPTFRWETKYKGEDIVRSYDIYINALNYCVYVMLSAMEEGEKAAEYLEKAERLEVNMRRFYNHPDMLPSYGDLLTEGGDIITADPYGMDRTDFRWALALPLFKPNSPEKYRDIKNQLLRDLRTSPKGAFLCAYNALITSMDTEIHDEDEMMAALNYLVPQSVRPGKYLPMPYAVPELVDQEDGDPFHDVRPLVYSIAPWLSAVTNFGIRRLPFGIAARATKYLESLTDYEYKNALIDVTFEGQGDIDELLLNREAITGSFQIPEKMLVRGDNRLTIRMTENADHRNVLVASTVVLNKINSDGTFNIGAYGVNVLVFKNLDQSASIKNASGAKVNSTMQKMDEYTFIGFKGRGNYHIVLSE